MKKKIIIAIAVFGIFGSKLMAQSAEKKEEKPAPVTNGKPVAPGPAVAEAPPLPKAKKPDEDHIQVRKTKRSSPVQAAPVPLAEPVPPKEEVKKG